MQHQPCCLGPQVQKDSGLTIAILCRAAASCYNPGCLSQIKHVIMESQWHPDSKHCNRRVSGALHAARRHMHSMQWSVISHGSPLWFQPGFSLAFRILTSCCTAKQCLRVHIIAALFQNKMSLAAWNCLMCLHIRTSRQCSPFVHDL